MLRAFLKLFGYRMGYVSEYGWHRDKYDRWGGFSNWGHDSHFNRPIHREMLVAPPWAKLKIERAHPSPPLPPIRNRT